MCLINGLAVINSLVWLFLTMEGTSFYGSMRERLGAGYPSPVQTALYVYLPAAILALVVAERMWAIDGKHYRVGCVAVQFVAFAFILPFLLTWSGGI